MPETRLLSTQPPRTTTLPRTQIAAIPSANPTGAFVSASPAAGRQVHAQAAQARQAATMPPSARPPGVRSQDARVELIAKPGAPAGHAFGGATLATNQRPTVQLIQRPTAGQAQIQIPPGGGVALTFEEACLVGQLLDKFVEGAIKAQNAANAQLGGATLDKMSAYVRVLAEMTTQAQMQVQVQPIEPIGQSPQVMQIPQVMGVPVPTRVNLPAQPAPSVQILPNQTAPQAPPAWPAAQSAVVVPAWPPATPVPLSAQPATNVQGTADVVTHDPT